MIRKILLFIALSFSIAWFAGAYLIKSKVVSLIRNSNSENVKLLYNDIKVSGFPLAWKINLIEPKIIFINSADSKEISTEELICIFDFSLKKTKIVIEKELKYRQNLGDEKTEYLLRLSKDIENSVKFIKPIYDLSTNDNIDTAVKSVQLKSKLLSFLHDDKEMFKIADLVFALNKDHYKENEDILIKLQALYEGPDNFLNFNSASLNFSGAFNISVVSNLPSYLNAFKVSELDIAFGDSQIGIKGAIAFTKGKLPQGKLTVNLVHYDNIINNIIPEHFIIPRVMLNNLVEKVVSNNSREFQRSSNARSDNDIKFDIEFSENGVNIGSINLLDFKAED